MLVSLDGDARAESVRRELVRRGLWVQRLSDARGEGGVHFLVRDGSAAVSAGERLGIPGVASVAAPEPSHPRIDAQPSALEVAGARIGGPAR